MKITNRQVVILNNVLASLGGFKQIKIAWMIARNKAKIDALMTDIRKILESSEGLKKYIIEADALENKYRQGMAQEDYAKELEDLKVKYAAEILEKDELTAKEKELLDQESGFEPYTIRVGDTRDPKNPDESLLDSSLMGLFLECGILVEDDPPKKD